MRSELVLGVSGPFHAARGTVAAGSLRAIRKWMREADYRGAVKEDRDDVSEANL
jgi:hypothetical protein